MRIFYSEKHALRDAQTELDGGLLARPYEHPGRMTRILEALKARGLGPVEPPGAYGLDPVRRVHDAAYLHFLSRCWREWRAAGHEGEAIPVIWPSRRLWREIAPKNIEGMLGFYALAAETSITEGTWEAAKAAADTALSAAAAIAAGAPAAFALCRPPGHHAAADMFGGYCFLNNAAIAAQALRDAGAERVAVLDVDFHHGNGTQSIFYDRRDVFFASIHGAPEDAFPHFLGYADETGAGAGEGFTANYPLSRGTAWPEWSAALGDALARLKVFRPEALVLSLGVDAYHGDPISFFALETEDFQRMGAAIAGLGAPTALVMEGGYADDALGVNVVAALEGFSGGGAR
ncbi:MAG: histone deacetylase family protein [Pseudomonadota bacterium]